ncbi:MAG: hypothetical protein LQ340_005114 [Diploschistes diacapsis]|nr:MAG: hypothetical protein LQ340_005114 [Diploschistes diacapsis]
MFFGLGGLFYVSILLVNAVAVLSEDRFLARIGWGSVPQSPGFGGQQDAQSVKAKIVNLIASVRTLMRSTSPFSSPSLLRPPLSRSPAAAPLETQRRARTRGSMADPLNAVPLIFVNTFIIVYELLLG